MSFCLALLFGRQLYCWVAGIDYARLEEYEPYHYLYRFFINYAIEGGFSLIDGGRGSAAFKMHYGFRPHATYLALSTPHVYLRDEVERWNRDISGTARIRREGPARSDGELRLS